MQDLESQIVWSDRELNPHFYLSVSLADVGVISFVPNVLWI